MFGIIIFITNRIGNSNICSLDSKVGLIVVQEWWGLNVSITKTADEFAALGFRTIVPDL